MLRFDYLEQKVNGIIVPIYLQLLSGITKIDNKICLHKDKFHQC